MWSTVGKKGLIYHIGKKIPFFKKMLIRTMDATYKVGFCFCQVTFFLKSKF